MDEIYFSTDVETNGPIPWPNSMLSLGSAAYNSDGALLETFYANLEEMPGSVGDVETMKWWESQPEAWKAARENAENPGAVMQRFCDWVTELSNKWTSAPVFVAYPAGFDFMFVYWYLMNFVKKSPFSFSAVDIKTYAMAMLKGQYRKSVKRNMPRRWFDKKHKHTHKALDDAVEQGALFCNMLLENKGKR